MSYSLPTLYQQFIHLSRYARWDPSKKRRETWEETVARYFDFFENHLQENLGYKLSTKERNQIESAVLNLEVMPSMRSLMTAGPALKRDNIAGYNCSYVAVNRLRAFDEILYVLMCGTGVGFSVEKNEVNQLPSISEEFYDTDTTIVVNDSKLGWAKAYKELVSLLVNGQIPQWDVSKIRPAGARLKTFGGRASGPDPLVSLFSFTVDTFRKASGRRLTSMECHDIVCKVAEIVVVGGVRRSALISLSSMSDDRMRDAKSGQWWISNPQRSLSNNSAVYDGPLEIGKFMEEWLSLYKSKSGERGIFNRNATRKQCKRQENWRKDSDVIRNPDYKFGTNPCSEIILRDCEFCNLTEVVVRPDDTPEDLKRKVKIATILGTWQSSLVDFRYLSSSWKNNCEEERLLGVSMTGIMDSSLTNHTNDHLPKLLQDLRGLAIKTNLDYAKKLGLEQSAAITCVKPSGTVSQLVNSSSGIHARHNKFYIRTVRADNKDPLCQLMKNSGFPYEPCVMKPDHVTVFSFPQMASPSCVCRNDLSAIEQLELWTTYQEFWCEHKPSVTITVKEDEWLDVGAWVWKNLDQVSGISFLPFADHSYRQAPYQDCTEKEYNNLLKQMPANVNWTDLAEYEQEDNTAGTQTFACSGNSCEVVDLTSN